MPTDVDQCLPGCTQLTHRLFYCLDESKYEQLVSLFEEGGVWHRQGEVLKGREQILRAMAKRPSTQRIRHVITNCFIESASQGLVNLVAYMVAYRFDDGTMHTGPVKISRPFRISVVRAALRQTEGTWKVADINLTPEFEFMPDVASPAAAK
jgi:hypothetical protein